MSRPAKGIEPRDRAIYEGIGQRRGKFCTVLYARRDFSGVAFLKDGAKMLVTTPSLTVVPTRPDGDF